VEQQFRTIIINGQRVEQILTNGHWQVVRVRPAGQLPPGIYDGHQQRALPAMRTLNTQPDLSRLRRRVLPETVRCQIVELVTSGLKTRSEAARLFGVHPSTVTRALRRAGISAGGPAARVPRR